MLKDTQKSVVLGNSILILEKRYPKLIYSYKKFFLTLNKLLKQSDFYDELAKFDIYVLKEKHSLGNYEQILKDVNMSFLYSIWLMLKK